MDEAASPISPIRDGHSPLRNGAHHPGFQGGANYGQAIHGRHKSIERDQKDSPAKQLRPSERPTPGYSQGHLMGSHLTLQNAAAK